MARKRSSSACGERTLCAVLSETETRGRELRALEEAMGELGVADATVVTLADEETVTVRGRRVRVVSAWRRLLEGDRWL